MEKNIDKDIGGRSMNIENEIFKSCTVEEEKLLLYGFKKENDNYIYEIPFMEDSFKAEIYITKDSKVFGKVVDQETGEEYINIRIQQQTGSFVNRIREEYQNILKDIQKNCFQKKYYLYEQTNRIIKKVEEKYHVSPEFLWKKDPYSCIFRKEENKKWFLIIMKVDKSKIQEKTSGEVEILNVKLDEEVKSALEKEGIYECYHMSKKNWVTILLDNTLSDEEILTFIDKSYKNISK